MPLLQQEAAQSCAQLALDSNVVNLSAHATDLQSIAGFAFAGLIGKIARFGISSSLSNLGFRSITLGNGMAHLGSIGAEACSLSFLDSISSTDTDVSLSSLFLRHSINLSAFRLMGAVIHVQHSFLQHFSQSAAMMIGHQVAHFAGLAESPEGNLLQQFTQANIATLQMSLGNHLFARLHGNKLHVLERKIEESSRSNSWHSIQATPSAPIRMSHLSPTPEIVARMERTYEELTSHSHARRMNLASEALQKIVNFSLSVPSSDPCFESNLICLNKAISFFCNKVKHPCDPRAVTSVLRVKECKNSPLYEISRNTLLEIALIRQNTELQQQALEGFLELCILHPPEENGSHAIAQQWQKLIPILQAEGGSLDVSPLMVRRFAACLEQEWMTRSPLLLIEARIILVHWVFDAHPMEVREEAVRQFLRYTRNQPELIDIFAHSIDKISAFFPHHIQTCALQSGTMLRRASSRSSVRLLDWLDKHAEELNEVTCRRIFLNTFHAAARANRNTNTMESFHDEAEGGKIFLESCIKRGFHPPASLLLRAIKTYFVNFGDGGNAITNIPLFMQLFPPRFVRAKQRLSLERIRITEDEMPVTAAREILRAHSLKGAEHIRIYNRSLSYELRDGRQLVFKIQNAGETLEDLYHESVALLNTSPLALRSALPQAVVNAQGRPVIARMSDGKLAIVFVAHSHYYRYLEDLRNSEAEFRSGLKNAMHDIGLLAHHDRYHLTPARFFHNQEVEAETRYNSDFGRYVVFPELVFGRLLGERQGMGRLDDWPSGLQHGNFGVTGLRDFQEIADIEEIILRPQKFCPELSSLVHRGQIDYLRASLLANSLLVAQLYVGQRMANNPDLIHSPQAWRDPDFIRPYSDFLWELGASLQASHRQISYERAHRRIGGHWNRDMLAAQLSVFMSHIHASLVANGQHAQDLPAGLYPQNVHIGRFGPYRPGTFSDDIGFIGPNGERKKKSLGPVNGQNPILEMRKAILAALY